MSAVLKKKLDELFDELPETAKAEVIDFVEFLREKQKKQAADKPQKKRIAGLHEGQIWMSEDFDDPLPDEFWFGEDFGLIEKGKDESAP